jgi:hypothetical protein
MGVVGVFGIALLIFLIWNDPHNAADTVGEFFSWMGDVISQAWHKIGDFIGDLSGP